MKTEVTFTSKEIKRIIAIAQYFKKAFDVYTINKETKDVIYSILKRSLNKEEFNFYERVVNMDIENTIIKVEN